MGQITQYQRNNLVSARVGGTTPDTSGAVVAKSATDFGQALVERQQALDKVEYTNAYYAFAREDAVLSAELKQKTRNDPMSFRSTYDHEATKLADSMKSNLNPRLRGKFDTLVLRHKASVAGSNEAWIFNQQNQNAIDGAHNFAQEYAATAATWSNGAQYKANMQAFDAEFESTYAPILTTASARQLKQTATKNAALMYMSSRMDVDTGSPLEFQAELKQDPELKSMLQANLGAAEFLRLEKAIDKQVKAYVDADTAKFIEGASKTQLGYFTAVLRGEKGYSLPQIELRLLEQKNLLNKMQTDNVDGLYDKAIAEQQGFVQFNEQLLSLAQNVHDNNVSTDYAVMGELQAELVDAISGVRTAKEQRKVAEETGEDLGRGLERGFGWAANTANWGQRLAQRRTGTPSVTASATYSQHIEKLTKFQAKVLQARNEGKLTNKSAESLLSKVVAPLYSLERYDKLKGTENNYIARAYNSFNEFSVDAFSRNIPMDQILNRTQVKNIRQDLDTRRDKLRTDMFMDFMSRVEGIQSMGKEVTEADVSVLVNGVKQKYFAISNPDLAGVPVGGIYQNPRNGLAYKFLGFDNRTGKPLVAPNASADEAVKNL